MGFLLNLMTFVSSLYVQMWCRLVVQFPWWNGSKQCYRFCPVMDMGTKLVFIVKFYLKCVSDNGLKEALKIKSLDSVKVLNLRRLEHEFSYSMWFDFIAMRFVADTADFPAICHVSDAKDITRNRRETSLRYKQFGKGIVKYEACKQNFTLFCSTSEP